MVDCSKNWISFNLSPYFGPNFDYCDVASSLSYLDLNSHCFGRHWRQCSSGWSKLSSTSTTNGMSSSQYVTVMWLCSSIGAYSIDFNLSTQGFVCWKTTSRRSFGMGSTAKAEHLHFASAQAGMFYP